MEYRKNDIVTLKIEDCGIDGEGIGPCGAEVSVRKTMRRLPAAGPFL